MLLAVVTDLYDVGIVGKTAAHAVTLNITQFRIRDIEAVSLWSHRRIMPRLTHLVRISHTNRWTSRRKRR